MIIELKQSVTAEQAENLGRQHESIVLQDNGRTILVTSSKVKELPAGLQDLCERFHKTDSDIQLAARSYMPGKRSIRIGDVLIGGGS